MVIQHNMSALNASRQFNTITKSITKSSEKLSSGYKINRAADDAAGLSISEKMRKQIRGLSQAAENIQDGISLCQVADGALNETVDILQRMNELSIQAANGTNSTGDRSDIQFELNQLCSEVNRISETTSFNEWIYPLKNDSLQSISNTTSIADTWSWQLPDCLHEETFKGIVVSDCTHNGISYQAGDSFTFNVITITTEHDKNRNRFRWFSNNNLMNGYYFSYSARECTINGNGRNYADLNIDFSDLKFDDNGFIYYEFINVYNKISKAYIYETPSGFGGTTAVFSANNGPSADNTNFLRGVKIKTSQNDILENNSMLNSIWIQSTDEVGKGLLLHTVDASMKGLFSGTTVLSVFTEADCDTSINKISDALKVANGYRSYFGAIQNRLEHAYNINLNTVENTTYAESQIRDADMASEMVKYSNSSILSHAGQAMLAQANQSNQGVLSLIA